MNKESTQIGIDTKEVAIKVYLSLTLGGLIMTGVAIPFVIMNTSRPTTWRRGRFRVSSELLYL